MNINQILQQYDAMFGKCTMQEIETYLIEKIEEAKAKTEYSVLFTLLNEIIGFCRDTTQKEKALRYCDELFELLKLMNLEGRVDYATALLNIANAYRAFGLFNESISLYEQVLVIYLNHIEEKDFSYASLYNNWSLVYQEIEEYEKAAELLRKALTIVDGYEEAIIPQATTRVNLAVSLINVATDEAFTEAMEHLGVALVIFEKDGGRDFHYGAALVAMGDAYAYKKEYSTAASYYKKGMQEIEKHVGKTDNYVRVLEKYEHMKKLGGEVWTPNLEKSQEFYENYGKQMIHEKFSEYEDRIAVGVVGEGSDAYGFDDEISEDHDYEPGFCMWLLEEDYQLIGAALQEAYEKLANHTGRLKGRRGVFTVSQFYGELLGVSMDYEKEAFQEFKKVEEYQLAAATNGRIFRDDAGAFTRVREQLLKHYPENIWRQKLAKAVHDFSQYAQSNYARMMARQDLVTVNLCVAKAVESAMDIWYLLNRVYAPYYKWKKKGLEKISNGTQLLDLLERIAMCPEQNEAWSGMNYRATDVNKKDKKICLFEEVASIILQEMKRQNLVSGEDLFLERYVKQILEGKNMDIIEKIVELEWKQFDKVKNEGGRADCQDNFATFSIMRKSQYMTWTDELLNSFCNDLQMADAKGWNLIMEKYARMMESTNPDKYEELEKDLPVLSEERIAIQEEIIKVQVDWMETFAKNYPYLAANMRSIRTSSDNEYNTSYETYLRGELGTYSENTFVLYTGFIIELLKAGRNLAEETMENTLKLYGYESLDEAEGK